MSEPEKETQSAVAEQPAAQESGEKPSLAERAARPAQTVARATVAGTARPQFAPPKIGRRSILRLGFWTGLVAAAAGSLGASLDMIYPRKIKGFGGPVSAGNVSDYPPGSMVQVPEGKFWMVHLTEEQGGPGLLALWWKCPHLGCTVPWREGHTFTDPRDELSKTGWFVCPCHGSTYDHAGVRVYGPAPRSMDTMKLTIDDKGRITVDTGVITPGTPDNASRATPV